MRKSERAFIQIQKYDGITGAGALALTTTLQLPVFSVQPINPDGIIRPDTIQPTVWVTHEFQGKKAPAVALTMPFKPSYCTWEAFNDFVLNRDNTNWNTSGFHIRINDGAADRFFGWNRCHLLNILATATGIALVSIGFTGLTGDSEVALSGVSWPSSALDLGQITDVTRMVWSAGASDVVAMNLSVAPTQVRRYRQDGTLYGVDVQTRKVRGGIMIQQDADAGTVPTTAATVRLGASGAGNGVQIAMNLSRNAATTPIIPDEGEGITTTRDFALANLATGGAAIAFANW